MENVSTVSTPLSPTESLMKASETTEYSPSKPYTELVGSLMYAATGT